MNKRQICVLIAVAILIPAMLLYPPIYYGNNYEYRWLLGSTSGRVEVGLILVQFVAVGIVASIFYELCADQKE